MSDAAVLVAVAVAAVALPVAFVAVLVVAAVRRSRDETIGPVLGAIVSLLGGLSLGALLLMGTFSPIVAAPILLAGAATVIVQWGKRRHRGAGLVLTGLGAPAMLAELVPAIVGRQPGQELTLIGLAGAASVVLGIALTLRGDALPPPPTPTAPPGAPGSRRIGNVVAAILEPSTAGPFSMPAVAAIVAFVTAWLLVPLAVSAVQPSRDVGVVATATAVVLGAVLATEAYLHALPRRSRRAFEAFSWLGEWELGEARRFGPVPRSEDHARRWLGIHPTGPDDQVPGWLRVEVLTLAARLDEARKVADAMPQDTPLDRWRRAEALDLVDWLGGGDGDETALRRAAGDLPADSDDRLRAEVSIAVGQVRRRMADGRSTPGDAIDPLLAVRELLGPRADGQIGRALRVRILRTSLVVSAVLAVGMAVVSGVATPLGRP